MEMDGKLPHIMPIQMEFLMSSEIHKAQIHDYRH
jgi:hypothetical protein